MIVGRTVTSPLLHRHLFRCFVVPSLHGRDAGARSSTAMPHAAPLLPPSLLTPHATRLASSYRASRYIGTVYLRTIACHMSLSSATLLVHLTTPTPTHGQNSHPSSALHGTYCCSHCALRRASTHSLCRHIELSPPSPLLEQASVAPTQCAAIKGTSPVISIRTSGSAVHWSQST
jgi:hypothetical protein